jgi:hypothetical protein
MNSATPWISVTATSCNTFRPLDPAVLPCRITDENRWCRRCGERGIVRARVTGELAYEPLYARSQSKGWELVGCAEELSRLRIVCRNLAKG